MSIDISARRLTIKLNLDAEAVAASPKKGNNEGECKIRRERKKTPESHAGRQRRTVATCRATSDRWCTEVGDVGGGLGVERVV